MPRVTGDVIPQSKMFPLATPKGQERAIAPLQRRMAAAAERLEAIKADKELGEVDARTRRALGKVVLEFEQVNNNLQSISAAIRADIANKNKIFREEKKLAKKEEDALFSLKAGFGARAAIGGLAFATSFSNLQKGNVGAGLADLGLGIASFLPEIISLTSAGVLAKIGFGRSKNVGANPTALTGGQMGRMSRRMPRIGGRAGLALGGAALIGGLALGSGSASASEERRAEFVRQETETKVINRADVSRFDRLITRFMSALDIFDLSKKKKIKKGVGGPAQSSEGKDDGGADKDTPSSDTPVEDTEYKGTSTERAIIQTIREVEGTTGGEGFSKFFGGRTDVDITKMTGNQVAALQKQRLARGEATYNGRTSAAVGVGQFMKPEAVMRDMKLDPETTLMTPEVQLDMMMHLIRKKRKVVLEDGITPAEMYRLNEEWSGLGPRYGQTKRTREQSLNRFQQLEKRFKSLEDKGEEVSLFPTSTLPKTSPSQNVAMALPTPQQKSSTNLVVIPQQQQSASPAVISPPDEGTPERFSMGRTEFLNADSLAHVFNLNINEVG